MQSSKLSTQMDESELYPSLLALVALCGAWLLATRFFSTSNNRNPPPSPPKLPIIGNLHQLRHISVPSLTSLSKKYGPLMLLHLGNKPLVVISSAEVAKEVHKTNDVAFSSRPYTIATRRLYYDMQSLLTSPYGDQWRKFRYIYVNHLLHKRMIKTFYSIIDEETSFLLEHIDKFSSIRAPVNLTEMFTSLAIDTVSQSAFGLKCREGEGGDKILDFMEETMRFLFSSNVGDFFPWLAWTNRWNGYNAEITRLSKAKDELLDARIHQYMENSEKNGDRDCFADMLLGLIKGSTPGMRIDWDTMKAIIQDVVGAGTTTVAAALEWTMSELIRHPHITKKLQEDLREIMKGNQSITEDEFEKMQYLKAIINESLRLHPPAPIPVPRATTEDVKVMGYDIPSGAIVLQNLWAIGRDPTFWSEPEKFIPERFLNSSINYNGFYYQFIPFGAGRRICPGISFSRASIERVVSNLVHRFDWQLPNGAKVEELDMAEKPGFQLGRSTPLIAVPTKRCL